MYGGVFRAVGILVTQVIAWLHAVMHVLVRNVTQPLPVRVRSAARTYRGILARCELSTPADSFS